MVSFETAAHLQRLAQRRARDPETGTEIALGELFSRRQVPFDDQVAQAFGQFVVQRAALDRC
jgi:hypothetical protein